MEEGSGFLRLVALGLVGLHVFGEGPLQQGAAHTAHSPGATKEKMSQ